MMPETTTTTKAAASSAMMMPPPKPIDADSMDADAERTDIKAEKILFDFQFYVMSRTGGHSVQSAEKFISGSEQDVLSAIGRWLLHPDVKSGGAEVINSDAAIPFHKRDLPSFETTEHSSSAAMTIEDSSRLYNVKFYRMVNFRRISAVELQAAPVTAILDSVRRFINVNNYLDGYIEFSEIEDDVSAAPEI